ncbi:MAG TPA: DUF1028 domain-containing protein [Actinomycetota bacterium]|nr:DUF1028 domain-containing protein [Actinomycetota bacterium]
MTFSIVAWDPRAEPRPEWGVAVASKFLAVGAVVPWASAGAGAVATQALANVSYGPRGLELLRGGAPAGAVVDTLTRVDDGRDHRQLGVVDASGRAATYTGAECLSWAGGRTGDGYCCQGNILTGPEVVDRMCDAFEATAGDLATRLLAALDAGDAAGGDARGRQSAALLVVRAGGSYGGGHDVALDLRVDDHAAPIPELARLVDLHRVIFPRPGDLRFVPVDDDLARELRAALRALGHDPGDGRGYDDALRSALLAYVGTENLEERWSDGDEVEAGVVEHLRRAAGS